MGLVAVDVRLQALVLHGQQVHARLEVSNEVPLHDVGLATEVAAVALDADVELHVGVQVGLLVEALGAHLALEGPLAAAHRHVALKLLLVQEDLAAQHALVGALGVVDGVGSLRALGGRGLRRQPLAGVRGRRQEVGHVGLRGGAGVGV